MIEGLVTRFVNSRYCLMLMLLAGVVVSYVCFLLGDMPQLPVAGPYVLPPERWLETPFWSWAVNVAVVAVVAFVLTLLDKHYAFVKEYTFLYAGYFLFIVLVDTRVSYGLGQSSITALAVVLCAAALFADFQKPARRSSLFLSAAILSACSIADYSAAFYLPLVFVWGSQMQLMSFKGALAILLGAVTPWWIVFGSGLLSPENLRLPEFALSLPDYLSHLAETNYLRLVLAIATGTVFGIINFFTIMSYRQQLRSYNGFFNAVAVATIVYMLLDIAHVDNYMVVLDLCIGLQAGQFFTIYKFRRRYMLLLLLLIANLGCTVADMFDLF